MPSSSLSLRFYWWERHMVQNISLGSLNQLSWLCTLPTSGPFPAYWPFWQGVGFEEIALMQWALLSRSLVPYKHLSRHRVHHCDGSCGEVNFQMHFCMTKVFTKNYFWTHLILKKKKSSELFLYVLHSN